MQVFNGKIKTILFSDRDLDPNSKTTKMIPLSEHLEDLNQMIESSKIFIKSIIEKVRYQGKIKIVNKLNNNPQHPQYESSFPDLLNVTPKTHNEDSSYTRLDENFDLEGRKHLAKIDSNFKKRMNKSVQESYMQNFIVDKNSWKVSDKLNSWKNIQNAIIHFQKSYENLKLTSDLNKTFMDDFNVSLFIINDQIITPDNREKMIQDFKTIIPDSNSQKIISIYANPKFLYQSYLQLISEHPEIDQYQIKNSRNIYKIDNLNDGSIKLVATHLSDLNVQNSNYIQKYKSLGVRATVIIYPNDFPIIKYSHFVK